MKKLILFLSLVLLSSPSFGYNEGEHAGIPADRITLEDEGGYYDSENVEDAFQEIPAGDVPFDSLDIISDLTVGGDVSADTFTGGTGNFTDVTITGDITVTGDSHLSANVGIGTTAPSQMLVVDTGGNDVEGYIGVRLDSDNRFIKIGNPGSDVSQILVDDNDSLAIGQENLFSSDGDPITELVRITRSGANALVGIGTSTPSAGLDVIGDIEGSGDIEISGSGTFVDVQIDGALTVEGICKLSKSGALYNFTTGTGLIAFTTEGSGVMNAADLFLTDNISRIFFGLSPASVNYWVLGHDRTNFYLRSNHTDANNVQIRLGGNAGSEVFEIENSNTNTVFDIDSLGNATSINTVQGEQLTSTDDITMQGHLLTMGDNTSAANTVLEFLSSGNDATITYDQSEDEFEFGNADITSTGAISGTIITDGTALLSSGNLTDMGNITGTDVDLSLGTGDLITTGDGLFNDVGLTGDLTVSGQGTFNEVSVVGDITVGDDLYVTGNVGIGTTEPSKRLHIVSTQQGQFKPAMVVENTGAGTTPTSTGILFSGRGSGLNKGGIAFEDVSGTSYGLGNLYFLNDGVSDDNEATLNDIRMTITSTGNVGVGTTAPGNLLEVAGIAEFQEVLITGDTTTTGRMILDGDSSMADYANSVHAIIFGDGQDSVMGYDGEDTYITNLVGAGDLRIGMALDILGDTWWTGAGTGLPYGDLYVHGNVTEQTIATATLTQVTTFATNGESNLTTPDHTTDDITISKTGKYLITISSSFSGDPNVTWSGGAYKNNGVTQLSNIQTERKLGAGGDVGSVSMSGIASLAADDTVEVWFQHAEGVSKSITVKELTLSVVMVGG